MKPVAPLINRSSVWIIKNYIAKELGKMDKNGQKERQTVPENYIHTGIIHRENIRKEMKHADKNIMKNFQLNPHNSI